MDWLARYVENVKTYLPGKMRDDIGSELYSELQDQYDDMANSLGREPTESEILGLIKRKGHPMQAAAAFQPRKTLISESLFPLYLLVLKWLLLAMFILNGVVVVLSLLYQPEPNFIRAFVQWLAGTFNAGLHLFAWVTLAFYLAGETISYRDFFGKWDPRRLPDIVDGNQRIGRFDSALALAVLVMATLWLNDLFTAVRSPTGEGARFVFSAEFQAFLPWLNIALGLSILMELSKLFMPYWNRAKLLLDGAINLYWLALLAVLFPLQQVFSVHWSDAGGRQWDMPLASWRITLAVVFIIAAYELFRDIQRYLRTGRR